MSNEQVLCKGIVEKIGDDNAEIFHKTHTLSFHKYFYGVNDHNEAFKYVRNILLDKKFGVIKSIDEISAVGHRVVHGGEFFSGPALINSDTISKIEALIPLAPLHNKSNLAGIKACIKLFNDKVPQVAVFDTSYYTNFLPEVYMYPIPYEYYEKHSIRKYGFHGTSHQYVSKRCSEMLNKDISELKIVSCHLGNGSSITAIKNGIAVDTSMGLTPLGGVMMGTRCGSMDPSVVIKMAQEESLSMKELSNILNKESGLKGVSGISNDEREVLLAEELGNPKASLAHKMMIYQITHFIGGYIATMGGCNAIIFTGGIGENIWIHRQRICHNFSFMGLKLNEEENKRIVLGKTGKISKNDSSIDVVVIPTNEELAIAKLTLKLIGRHSN